MSTDRTARNRWFAIVGVRIAAAAGAVLGIILAARASDWTSKGIGIALVLAALYVMAVVPLALAHRWRTPPDQ